MSFKLPPLDLGEDVNKYEAYQEQTAVSFNKCPHNNVEMKGNELICKSCRAGWTGPRIIELYELLKR